MNKKTLYYGTGNQGKLDHMQEILAPLKITLKSAYSIMELTSPEEVGKDPLQIAKNKVRAYYEQVKRPVFSCDSGLYFKEVSPEDQPGTLIRRKGSIQLSDEEMITYYADLAKKYGGRLTAYYKNAIAFIDEGGRLHASDHEMLWSKKFYLISEAHKKRRPGFPLDSLSVDPESNKYYLDQEVYVGLADEVTGFQNFFRSVLKEVL